MPSIGTHNSDTLTDDVLGEPASDHGEEIFVLAHQVASRVDLVAEADLDPVRAEIVAIADHVQIQIGHLQKQHRPTRFGLDQFAGRVLAQSRQLLLTHDSLLCFLLNPLAILQLICELFH